MKRTIVPLVLRVAAGILSSFERRVRMKSLVPVFLLLILVGCSRTHIATVVSEKWDVGQHQSCFYGHEDLFCGAMDDMKGTKSDGTAATPIDILLDQERTPYRLALYREVQLRKAKDLPPFSGVYETKFTSSAMDFSLWDCYRTGLGSPAIRCTLKLKPTKDETKQYVALEKEQADLHKRAPAIARFLRELRSKTDALWSC